MDYEKAYKEALERAKESLKDGTISSNTISYIEEIFPELKESEDEKIRKELITHCRNTRCVTEEGAERIAKWIAWLEKQCDANKEYWRGYREGMEKILDKYAELEKQGEQKPTDKPKFKVKYAGSEYNVFETKDIAGVTFYGIEDEPNHIDYVKADNCEIISGYDIKESGLSIPTKPVMFSWSEEDECNMRRIIRVLEDNDSDWNELTAWLKSLKPQNRWKPSDKQIHAFEQVYDWYNNNFAPSETLTSLYNDLKKLTE